ncbi:ALI_collapsed_G0005660.mRNA.1.CDS.1 [Saccharomyces cerevisiae]|nr:ALI_collapsed_G0005660.mRNA.1.CDS.1 [Saccharomyces cerevisiae]
MSVLFWIMAPKNNQAVCLFCFVVQCLEKYSDFDIGHDVLMWAITFLCQLHPLVAPRRSDLRPEFAE